jgi:pimeloyl-ACP methyl ester carboxylesterase
MNGRYSDAIKTARELEANVKPHLKMMPMLEMFMPYTTVVLVRFHRWGEILNSPAPARELVITGAFWRFARGMAFAATGRAAEAESELGRLRDSLTVIPADSPFGNSTARGVIEVAERLLAGRIALARGDRNAAIELLRKSVESEDAVGYNEPPDWDLPVREWLGGAMLSGGDHAEAERVYRAELAKHPRNGRALFGLVESLKRQGKDSSAQMVRREFDKAWANADTSLSVEDFGDPKSRSSISTNTGAQALRFGYARLKTGVRVHYAEQGDPRGRPVILLHGFTDSWFSFSRVLPLMNSGYHIYALDARGHGDSDRPPAGYELSDFAADVVAFMDAKGLKSVTLVGHSMGSFIAQKVALTAPERIERLVLIGSATTVRNDTVLSFEGEVNKLKDPVPAEFVRDFQVSTVYKPLPDEFLDRVVGESLKLPAFVWRATLKGLLAADFRPELGRIKIPTLIIWGDKETFFLRPEQDKLVAAIRASVLKVYPDTGHSPQWERPEQFARDFEEFMARTEPR